MKLVMASSTESCGHRSWKTRHIWSQLTWMYINMPHPVTATLFKVKMSGLKHVIMAWLGWFMPEVPKWFLEMQAYVKFLGHSWQEFRHQLFNWVEPQCFVLSIMLTYKNPNKNTKTVHPCRLQCKSTGILSGTKTVLPAVDTQTLWVGEFFITHHLDNWVVVWLCWLTHVLISVCYASDTASSHQTVPFFSVCAVIHLINIMVCCGVQNTPEVCAAVWVCSILPPC